MEQLINIFDFFTGFCMGTITAFIISALLAKHLVAREFTNQLNNGNRLKDDVSI